MEIDLNIDMINHIFEVFDTNKLKDISNLSDEFLLKSLLFEIEPNLESFTGRIDIVKDKTFPIKYSNMVYIINAIDSLFETYYEKQRLNSRVPVKKLILINDIIKGEEYQLLQLIEFIVVLSALSSKKDFYLDRIGECEEKIINLYLTLVEKYIPLETRNDCNESLININTSLIKYGNNLDHSARVIGVLNEKLSKKIEENEKEKGNLMKSLNEAEFLYKKEQKRSISLEKKLKEIENKYKDMQREVEVNNFSEKINKIHIEKEILEENFQISHIKNDIKSKEIELEEKNKEIVRLNKHHNEEIVSYEERIEILNEKILSYKEIAVENEKLKNKVKELLVFKEKQGEFEEMSLILESKCRQIENLINEKQGFSSQIEKFSKEVLNEKEKLRKKDYEYKQLNLDYNELKREVIRLETEKKTNEFSNLHGNHVDLNQTKLKNFNLNEIDSSLYNFNSDLPNNNGNNTNNNTNTVKLNVYEKEILTVKSEKAELIKNLKESIDENLKLSNENESLSMKIMEKDKENKILRQEKEKNEIEKEKIDLKSQKFDIEIQKKTLSIEKLEVEKRKIENDVRELKDKHTKLQTEKLGLIKEYEKQIEKIGKEKSILSNEVKESKIELEKMRINYENQSK